MVTFLKKLTGNMRNKKISDEQQLTFLKRFHRLLSSGYSLIEALEVIKWDPTMSPVAERIIDYLRRGTPLDIVFQNLQFNETITAYLYFSRTSDSVVANLNKAIMMFEHRLMYMKKLSQVLRYPIILLFIFILLLFFIKKSILPSFSQLFQTSSESSQTVYYSIQLIDYASNSALFLLVLGAVSLLGWHLFRKRMRIELVITIISAVPLVRMYMRMQTSYQFATHMAMLLRVGMSLKDILQHMTGQQSLPILAHYAQLMQTHLSNGQYVTSLLMELSLFESQIGMIFQKNSNVSTLEQDLSAYADILAENIQLKMMKILGFIQPIFFIVLASFIIFIYVTLMWPMFQLIKTM